MKDAEGKHLAVFMTDYLPRPVKAQGAWMEAMQEAYNYGGENIRPIIYNVASMTPPSGDTPSLLTWDEVQTVFHEFGHALHGMLTRVQYRGLAGTNTDRDLVEMPSQINEHWAFEPEVLKNYARHYKTGELIPDSLVQKLNESAQFNMGFMTTELVGAALLDMYWHKKAWTPEEAKAIDVKAFEQDVKNQLNMPALVEFRYRSPYFKHIFADDQYACGYYTYLWSQVLEADGYMAFEKAGCFDKATADAFRALLEGSEDQVDWRLNAITAKYDLHQPDQKVAFLKEATEMVAALPGQVEREVYAIRVAGLAEVTREAVVSEVERRRRRRLTRAQKEAQQAMIRPERMSQPASRELRYSDPVSAAAEEGLIRLLMLEPALASQDSLPQASDFSSEALGQIYALLRGRIAERESTELGALAGSLTPDEMNLLVSILQKPEQLTGSERALKDYTTRILEQKERREQSGAPDLNALSERLRDKGKGYHS